MRTMSRDVYTWAYVGGKKDCCSKPSYIWGKKERALGNSPLYVQKEEIVLGSTLDMGGSTNRFSLSGWCPTIDNDMVRCTRGFDRRIFSSYVLHAKEIHVSDVQNVDHVLT